MANEKLYELWDQFLEEWSPERVEAMVLEEYTNTKRQDAFVYWLEQRLKSLGSIAGRSSFKFGIYEQLNVQQKAPSQGKIWGAKYAWRKNLGASEQAAFDTVKARIVAVLQAAQKGNWATIEDSPLSPVLKWKIAFLYQNRQTPRVLPIYKKGMLFHAFKQIVPDAKESNTNFATMHQTLIEKNQALGDIFDIAETIWKAYEADGEEKVSAWAVPLDSIPPEEASELVAKLQIEPDDLHSILKGLLSKIDVAEGDKIALLIEGQARALGVVSGVEPGQYAWEQNPVSFPANLSPLPKYTARKLDEAETQELWSHLPEPDAAEEDPPAAKTRYWKIAPGANGSAWEACKNQGVIAIGWPALGDLAGVLRKDFEKKAQFYAKNNKELDGRDGVNQVWTFRSIQVGDKIVANQGTRKVLGLGTVVGGYSFAPDKIKDEDEEDLPHRLRVEWQDISPFSILQGGWRRTILELDEHQFNALQGQPKPPKTEPPSLPCDPKNIILYGPPGTGKTYSTVRRALELLLGVDALRDLKGSLVALFREKQAQGQIELVTFHQAYGYEEFVEGIRPVLGQGADEGVRYELHEGVFKSIAMRAAAAGLKDDADSPDDERTRLQKVLDRPGESAALSFSVKTPQYVLIIDEINRGNMSKILGEMITLLEPDKRLTAENELKLPLSYSPEHRFGVPPNLHILGTMNTADRSIALMDVALRRRFSFEEMMPNAAVIREKLKGPGASFVELVVAVFETLNKRIRFLYDREHQLGHAYFLEATDEERLRRVLLDRVLPMLQEYFYGAWDKICIVLGCPYDEQGKPKRKEKHLLEAGGKRYRFPVIEAADFSERETLGFDHDDYEDRVDHVVSEKLAQGKLDKEGLLRTFLAILPLKEADHADVLESLLGHPSAAPGDEVAQASP